MKMYLEKVATRNYVFFETKGGIKLISCSQCANCTSRVIRDLHPNLLQNEEDFEKYPKKATLTYKVWDKHNL